MIAIFAEDLIPKIFNYEVVLVPMGLNNSFNSGFRSEIHANFNEIKKLECEATRYGDRRKMGTISAVEIDNLTFVFCYMDKGGYRGGDSVDYDALESCLFLVKKRYYGKKIASPLIGVGRYDGNGNKERVIEILKDQFGGEDEETSINIFDFNYGDRKLNFFHEIAEARGKFKRKEISSDEYKTIRSEIEWRRKNGVYKKMPEGYEYRPKMGGRAEIITIKKSDLDK